MSGETNERIDGKTAGQPQNTTLSLTLSVVTAYKDGCLNKSRNYTLVNYILILNMINNWLLKIPVLSLRWSSEEVP